MNRLARWTQFVRERFPPGTHLPMVGLFVLANAGVARPMLQLRLVATLAVTLSFFFRLRLFDEIKDYAVDRTVNPDRPLARGLLNVGELKWVLVVLAAGELLVCASLSTAALVTHALAVGYSVLMYREFFIGSWLRPHLTTYAVMHTVVTAPLGWSVAAQVSGRPVWEFPLAWLGFGLVNWALFNIFEFARKTFAPTEERSQVDSYSSLFRPVGAAILTLSQVALAGLVVYRMPVRLWPHLVLAAGLTLAALAYLARTVPAVARMFRTVSAAYILSAYAVLAWQRWHP